MRPAHDGARAPDSVSQRLGQHVLVERQLRHDLLEARVLVLELPQPAQLAGAEPRVLLLRLADPDLPADVGDGRAGLDRAQDVGDLFLGELRASFPPVGDLEAASLFQSQTAVVFGGDVNGSPRNRSQVSATQWRKVASPTITNSNRLIGWLRRMEDLRVLSGGVVA